MATRVQTLGPGHVYIKFRGDMTGVLESVYSYLGTCETCPVVEIDQPKLPVMNDLAGRTFPFQKVEDGEQHLVTLVLNKFDYTVWRRAYDTYHHLTLITNHGIDDRYKRGSLHMGIGDFQLLLVNDFSGVAPFHPLAQADQPIGRLYFSAELVKAKEDPSANRAQTIAAAFRCDGIWDSSSRSFFTYTETSSGIGSFPAPD